MYVDVDGENDETTGNEDRKDAGYESGCYA